MELTENVMELNVPKAQVDVLAEKNLVDEAVLLEWNSHCQSTRASALYQIDSHLETIPPPLSTG